LTIRGLLAGVVVATAVLVAAGCGGGKEKSEGSRAVCTTTATTEATGLPASFPQPAEVTYTSVHQDGPTKVVEGYWTAGIDEAYKEYKDQVEQAGLTILFDEKEEHDAEISWKGSGRTGQIALRDDCSESDTTRIHITNRPA
jgi:hypothetical protein